MKLSPWLFLAWALWARRHCVSVRGSIKPSPLAVPSPCKGEGR
jgi:hypothetical protein